MPTSSALSPFQPQWKDLFRQEARKLSALFGEQLLEIHHIGSTAIEGLCAQPTIDLLGVTETVKAFDIHRAQAEKSGYVWIGESGGRTRIVALKSPGGPGHLRAHPEIRDEYAKLKTELAKKFAPGSDGYRKGKADFIENVLKLSGYSEEES